MSKSNTKLAPETAPEQPMAPQKRTKVFTFPDISNGGPAVTIEATSLEEATEIFLKGQATA
jgi:hypothetical protein